MSKGFVFRFQSILNLRDKVEESKRHDFGIAVRKLETEKTHLSSLQTKRKEMIENFNMKSQNAITTVREYRNTSNNLQLVDKSIRKQNNIINGHETEVEQCKVALINAKKETKILEKVKENDLSHFNYKVAKNEEMLIDHFVSYKSSRK